MQVLFATISMHHVDYTINGVGSPALGTVEGEIPSPAAIMAVVDAKVAIPEDTQTCFVRRFVENTFLENEKSDQQ